MADSRSSLSEAAEALQEADAAVADAVEPLQSSPAVKALGFLSEIGDQPQIRTLSAGIVVAGLIGGNSRLVRAGVRMILAHELATAIKNAVKNRVDRTRPRSREEAIDSHKMRPGDDHSKEETSFPSGHSAGAAAAAAAFAREYPEHRGGGVAAAQIPRCAHYPTDVGAGIAIGIASELAVNAGWRMLAAAVERD